MDNKDKKAQTMQVGDEILTEVLDDENQIDGEMVMDDDSEEEDEMDEEHALEEVTEEIGEKSDEEDEIEDKSVFTFTEHTDSVYAVKVNLSIEKSIN